MESKKLFRSMVNRKLCGVCGGLGEYLHVDPTLIRLLWIILCFPSLGTAVIVYFAAAVIMPEEV